MRRLSVWAAGMVVLSCGGGGGGVVRPEDYDGTTALGATAPVCEGAPKFARPLTVDLDADTRGDLEAQMKSGVVVVAYDCVNLRILSSCQVPSGGYEYAGTSRKEEVVQMKGLDELKVNLPIGANKLSSEVQAGRSIDLALVSVGRRSTTLARVARSELTGGCEGATHYLQKASVGAFSLATGSSGKVSAVADVFEYTAGGGSSEERNASSRDGSLESCRTSDPDAEKPPSECRSPLRVELIPVLEDGAPKEAVAAVGGTGVAAEQNPCRDGYKLVNGVCSNDLDAPYLCDPKNEQECRTQCDKGNAASCTNVGAAIANLYWKITWDKAREDARPFFKKACDAGDQPGCAGYVRTTFPSEKEVGSQIPLAKELLAIDKKACEAGASMACFDLGTYMSDVYEGQPFHDRKTALRYFERSCSLGHPDACNTAGLLHMSSEPAKGLTLYQRGCDGGDGFVCNQLALRLITGMDSVTKDLPRGERLAKRACDLSIDNCGFSGELMEDAGRGEEALALALKGCDDQDPRTDLDEGDKGRAQYYRAEACKNVGDFYAKGVGTSADAREAKSRYTKACELGDKRACNILKE